jgi:hypothetical protein
LNCMDSVFGLVVEIESFKVGRGNVLTQWFLLTTVATSDAPHSDPASEITPCALSTI